MIKYISDLHLNHRNIIKLCNRPYKDVNHMNECINYFWNVSISDDDIIYIIGDIGFGDEQTLLPLIENLHGHKKLVMGNHDKSSGINASVS